MKATALTHGRIIEEPPPSSVSQLIRTVNRLFDDKTRRRFLFGVFLSAFVAGIEAVGLVMMLPLLTILSGEDVPTNGISGRLVELAGTSDPDRLIAILAMVVFASFVLRALLTLAVRWWVYGVVFENEARTARRLLHRYLSAPYSFHLDTNSSQLIGTLHTSVDFAYNRVVTSMLTIATDGLVALLTVVVLVIAQPIAAAAAVTYFVVAYLILARVISVRSRRVGARLQAYAIEGIKLAGHSFGAIKHIQLGSHQEVFVDQLREVREASAATKRTNQFLTEVPRQYLELAFIVGLSLMILTVSLTQGRDSLIPVIGIFAVGGFRLLPGVVRIANASQTIQTGLPALALVVHDLEIEPIPPDEVQVDPATLFSKGLEVQNICFTYPTGAQPALKDVSISIRPGESLAFVGPSGAGKSTLVDVLMGLHPPSSGSLEIDGIPMQSIRRSWQRCIGLVPQDIYLLDGSVRENIAFGTPPHEIDDDRLARALRMAQLDDIIAGLPSGLDTVTGERGVRLSGGQRQRLGIARALYSGPRVLVLDEATSALDSETERRITETLRALHGQLTMITIAHRLSTIREADRIVILRDGRLEDEGNFDDLRSKSPHFDRLVQLSHL